MAEQVFRLANPFRRVISVQFAPSGWDFNGLEIISLSPVDIRNFVAKTPSGALGGLNPTTPITVHRVESSFGKSWAIGLGQVAVVDEVPVLGWMVIGPTRTVQRMKGGALDVYPDFLDLIAVNDQEWGIVAIGDDPGEPEQSVLATETKQVVVTPTTFGTLFPILGNFLYATWLGGGGAMRVYSANAEALIREVDPIWGTVIPKSTLYDVVFNALGSDSLSWSFYSSLLGLVDTFARGWAGTSEWSAVATKDAYYFLDVDNLVQEDTGDGGDPDQNRLTIAAYKVQGTVDGEGELSYAASKATFEVVAEPDFEVEPDSLFAVLGAVATRTQAYWFVVYQQPKPPPPDDDVPAVYKLILIDGDGNMAVLDENFPEMQPGQAVVPLAAAAGATLTKPYLATLHETDFGGTRTLRIYDDTGLVHTGTPDEFAASPATITRAGNTRDKVFFRSAGASGEDFLIEGNGSKFDFLAIVPTVSIATPGITSRDTIYNVGTVTGLTRVIHITNLKDQPDPAPDAPEVVDYVLNGVAASPSEPQRSLILSFQEFEAWAA